MKLNTETEFPMNHPRKAIEYPGTVSPIEKPTLLKDYQNLYLQNFQGFITDPNSSKQILCQLLYSVLYMTQNVIMLYLKYLELKFSIFIAGKINKTVICTKKRLEAICSDFASLICLVTQDI